MSADASLTGDPSFAPPYDAPSFAYDELRERDGELLPQWRAFLDHLRGLSPVERNARWEKARHLLHQNGISYDLHGEPGGLERAWLLGPLPVLMRGEDFRVLEQGLAQRARLLDALLRDLYGPQRALLENLLPPELVFENPGFLRACHGIPVARDCFLPLYAADVARLPHGRYAVIGDHTEAPSGAGYALENRIVTSSALPEAFRDGNIERLASFFRSVRETLRALSPHNHDNPRILQLSSDPNHATYFEQAYLAQYLGYTLVCGGDLTVRRDRVFLKTLNGLQPVDVILRRVRDADCDPLELRPSSSGVPGLVQAVRAGNVVIANPLGTGVLETPAILPYLDRLARVFLGEELRLPSIRTFFGGDPLALREALSSFDDLVVKRTFSEGGRPPVFTALLTAAQRSDLRARILAKPRSYVMQERVRPSVTPTLVGERLVAGSLTLRCFVVAGHNGYAAMPGALARVMEVDARGEPRPERPTRSNDTWVEAVGTPAVVSLLPPATRAAPLSRGGSELPSRASDNLFWLGRYAERAEAVARLVRAIGSRLRELSTEQELERSAEFRPLLLALAEQTALGAAVSRPEKGAIRLSTAERQLSAAVFSARAPGSVAAAVRGALRTGRLVRDRVSTDTWYALAALGDELHGPEDASRVSLTTLQDVLDRTIVRLAAFSGLVMDSMTRGPAFRFLDMGRRLERAVTTVSLLQATFSETCVREGALIEAVLAVADSSMTYRRRYLASLQVAPAVDLLLTDETNPRSVIYQLEAIVAHIEALPKAQDVSRSPPERIALRLLTDLKLADVELHCVPAPGGERPGLAQLLREFAVGIPELSEALCAFYLSHATLLRRLAAEEGPVDPDVESGGSVPP